MAEKKKSIHHGHRERFKKEFLDRPETFPDHKLLELLLFYADPRGDTNPAAHDLLERFNSLVGVLDAVPEELVKTPGVGPHAAVLIKAVKEFSGRYLAGRTDPDGIVNSVGDMYRLLRPYFFGAQKERVFLLCMDGKGRSLGVRKISEGSVNAAEVTARGVVEAALSLNATRAVLAHNHVSGLAIPSAEDKFTTNYLWKVLKTVNVELVDHLIFVDDDMVSMADSGVEFWRE